MNHGEISPFYDEFGFVLFFPLDILFDCEYDVLQLFEGGSLCTRQRPIIF